MIFLSVAIFFIIIILILLLSFGKYEFILFWSRKKHSNSFSLSTVTLFTLYSLKNISRYNFGENVSSGAEVLGWFIPYLHLSPPLSIISTTCTRKEYESLLQSRLSSSCSQFFSLSLYLFFIFIFFLLCLQSSLPIIDAWSVMEE